MGRPPLEVLERQIRQLHAAGSSQAEIAEAVGVTRWQVRVTAARLGLDWNKATTAAATAASMQHARKERAELALRWLDVAHDELDEAEGAEVDERHRAITRAAIATDKANLLARGLDGVAAEADGAEARAALNEFMAAIHGSVD